MNNFELHRLILLAALIFATVTDCKSRKIPIALFPATILIDLACRICTIGFTRDILFYMITAVVTFFVFVMFALFAKGGGDAIMMGGVGFVLGLLDTLKVVAFAGVIYLCTALVIHLAKKKKLKYISFPYAPFVLAGFLVLLVLELIHILEGGV